MNILFDEASKDDMKNLIAYGKKRGLGRVDLSATEEGYPIYKRVGFVDKEHRYTDMRYKYKVNTM